VSTGLPCPRPCRPRQQAAAVAGAQAGLTLVELLVAMAVGLIVALAAIAALVVSRQGFTTVDGAAQLRDNARFAGEIVQRMVLQAGYKEASEAISLRPANFAALSANPPPALFGFNNAQADSTDPDTKASPRAAGDPAYGSDVLVVRFQTSPLAPDSPDADRSMIDCAGFAADAAPTDRDDRVVNVLPIRISDGEPTLMCSRHATGSTVFAAPQPLVRGVELFQVLYGVDGVEPQTAPADLQAIPPVDRPPSRYLRADQLEVAGNLAATHANWRRVRSVRIGMVLRSAPNTAQDRRPVDIHPLGSAPGSAGGDAGTAMANPGQDAASLFQAPADGRLRQVVTFTVHLRNHQRP